MLRNLTHTGWNWPLIRGWLLMAVVVVLFWIGVFWAIGHIAERFFDALS
jgi:hypothetical protein